jgi:hypothetical protein
MSGALLAPFLVVLAIGLARFLIGSFRRTQDMPVRRAAFQTRLRWSGVLILAAGLVVSALVFVNAPPPEDDLLEAVALGNSKVTEYDMERIGGKANVYGAEFTGWFGSLWHGKRLAFTISTLSLGGCLACFVLAHPLLVNPRRRAQPAVDTK